MENNQVPDQYQMPTLPAFCMQNDQNQDSFKFRPQQIKMQSATNQFN